MSERIALFKGKHSHTKSHHIRERIGRTDFLVGKIDKPSDVRPDDRAVIINGGDGTARRVIAALPQDFNGDVLLWPAGTNNALARAVSIGPNGADNVLPLETLGSFLNEGTSLPVYFPGQIRSETFITDVGVGATEGQIAEHNRALRKFMHDILTGRVRIPLAALITALNYLMREQSIEEPAFDLYSVGPDYGRKRMFETDIWGKDITNVRVESTDSKLDTFGRLVLTYMCLGLGMKSRLPAVADVSVSQRFEVTHSIGPYMNSGSQGESFIDTPTTVQRSTRGIKIATLT